MHRAVLALLLSTAGTLAAARLFRWVDGPLYEPVRGGTPRGVGIVPALVYALLSPVGAVPALTLALLGFVDDALGRRPTRLGVEVGHLSRGLAMLATLAWCWDRYGPITGLVAGFLPQPANIVDTQPRAFTFALAVATLSCVPLGTVDPVALAVLWAALAPYVALDLRGRAMLGDGGNAALAVAGMLAATRGDSLGALAFLAAFTLAGAWYRYRVEPRLREYLERELGIRDPSFMDAVWDVLTGGALGDLVKSWTFGRVRVPECGPWARRLGYRRLVLIGRSTVGRRLRAG